MEELRRALRRLGKAVAVITSQKDGENFAMAATAVCEVSLDPPSMLICVNRSSRLHAVLEDGAPFAINILHHSQQPIADRCSGHIRGEARFELGTWRDGALGVKCLAGAQASIVCRGSQTIAYGTHSIFIGVVVDVLTEGNAEPLLYLDGRYMKATGAIGAAAN